MIVTLVSSDYVRLVDFLREDFLEARFLADFLPAFFVVDFFLALFFWADFFFADFFALAAPPIRPPFLEGDVSFFLPRPEPESLPPPSCLLTVAQARFLAVFLLTPCVS